MGAKENWSTEDSKKELTKRAKKVLDKIKKVHSEKKFETIKVCDAPLTYKLVEVKK